MGNKRAFEREYSLNIARLRNGTNEQFFEIGKNFFEELEYSLIPDGKVEVRLDIVKYNTHLDVKYNFTGVLVLECDRCTQPYDHQIDSQQRIIYSFDEEMDFEGYEVMFVDRNEPKLVIVQELYDFMNMSVPIRKVPPKEVHLCPPEVLAMLGLDENGEEMESEDNDTVADPRWEALKQLKDKLEDQN